MYSGNPIELLKSAYDIYITIKPVYDQYQSWVEEQKVREKERQVREKERQVREKEREEARRKAEHQQLWQTATSLFEQKEYEKALSPLRTLTQKFPQGKAESLYLSAWCYFKLRRRDEALQTCEAAIQASPGEELLRGICTLRTKINFGSGYWIQWLIATIIVGVVSLFGTIGLLGDRFDSDTSGLLALLLMGISIGSVHWFLMRMRANVGIRSLMTNVAVVLVSLFISTMLLSVNAWLGLSSFLGCTVIFTVLSIGRLVKQEVTT